MAYFLEPIFALCFSLKRKFVDPQTDSYSILIEGGEGERGGEEVKVM